MKPEGTVICTPLADNVRATTKPILPEFRRSSNEYSSLPSHYGKADSEKKSQADVCETATKESAYCTGRKRRQFSNRNQSRESSNNGQQTTVQSYGVLDESLSDADHSFGLSNNLSTESIRNACGYYDDSISDDDLIEVQITPECFQKQPNVRRSFKANCFNIELRKKRKTSEENPLCALSGKNNDEKSCTNGTEASLCAPETDDYCQPVEDVLNELDVILDIHSAVSPLDTSSTSTYEMETKIQDCLLDLDNYLEEMDDCSVANYDNDAESLTIRTLQKNHVRNHHRNRTLPLNRNRKTFPMTDDSAGISSMKHVDQTSCSELQRGHGFRKTISCSSESRCTEPLSVTPQHQMTTEDDASKIWRRNSMRRTARLMLPDDLNSTTGNATCLQEGTDNYDELIPTADSSEERNSLSTFSVTNAPTSHSSLRGELRRCFSQSDFSARNASASSNEVLTQDNIFENLVQNGSSHIIEDRPRQFGRRAEGHPRILSIRSDMAAGSSNCTIVNHDQRPMSAPAAANGYTSEGVVHPESHSAMYIGSEASSVRSSRNPSPVSIVSSSDYSSTAASTSGNIETNLVANDNLQTRNSPLDPENTQLRVTPGFNSEWPHSFSRTLALICCTLGLFNTCRFAVLTVHYGGNFILQFILLSIIFGIPLFWLQMCLGAKIKSGPVSMWKISPICRGIGIALVVVQCLIAIYSTVAISWVLVYLRDSFPSASHPAYRWQDQIYSYRPSSNASSNLTESLADYFNVNVLQRLQFAKRGDGRDVRFRVNDRLAFYLAILWSAVFLILCKGLKSFGKVIFVLSILPLITLAVVVAKLIYIADPSKLQNIFSAADFDDFLINSKTWTAAAQEAFLTWGLLGSSVIAITSRIHVNSNSKTTLRRDAILVVLVTFLGLSIAALMGLSCIQILNQQNYIYVPGSFEHPESYTAVYSLKAPLNTDLLSFPPKWVPHYSSFIGETYRRPATVPHRESGFQALRFISELFPAVVALSSDSISWVWAAIAFAMFSLLGLAQLCVMWKPISSALGNSTSSVLLSCVTGLLLSIPFATEMGISIIHYMDLLLGGSWFIPILWSAQIFGVFLIRGRPYNGDDLVNLVRMSGSMSAFLALSWNVLLPIGLITLAIIDYKSSLSNQFYYWRGKSYFSYWARKVAGLTQIGFLLLVPITAIVQIYRYLTNGPPDILERIQLLYRPSENASENRRAMNMGTNRGGNNNGRQQSLNNTDTNLEIRNSNDDAPPKYTPPPSYTTATGARLAKILRQSIRRSVRRILGEPGRSRPILPIDTEMNQQSLPPDYATVLTNPSGSSDTTDGSNRTVSETTEIGQRSSSNTSAQRSSSLGRNVLSSQKRSMDIGSNTQRPYTAEDVVTILRSSTRIRQDRRSSSTRNLPIIHSQNDNSFRSIENLVLNAEPLGQSPAVGMGDTDEAGIYNEQNNASVI